MKIKTFVQGPFATNCYLLISEHSPEAIAIDPADKDPTFIRFILDQNLKLKTILFTHGHLDHVSGAGDLKRHFNAPIAIHRADVALLSSAPTMARYFGLPEPEVPVPDVFLEENQVISLSEISLKVIHTPGHTPGGVCFLSDEGVFVGDTLFAGSIGRTDLPGGNYEQLIQSIHSKLLILDEELPLYPGHGPPTVLRVEKFTNPFLIQ